MALLALLWALPGLALANSYLFRGVIVGIDPKGGKRGPTITVHLDYSLHGEDDQQKTFAVNDKATVLLDGKLSTYAEACRVGHAVIICGDVALFRCYSKDWHLPRPEGRADPHNGWWTIRLPMGLKAELQVPNTKRNAKPGEMRTFQLACDLLLHIHTTDGKIGAAYATRLGKNGAYVPWHEVHADALRVTEDGLTGSVTITHEGDGRHGTVFTPDASPTADGVYELNCRVGEGGSLSGDFKGTLQGKQVGGTLTGSLAKPPVIGERWSACGRFSFKPTGGSSWYASFKRDGDTWIADGCLSCKMKRMGEMTITDASLEDGRLNVAFSYRQGTVTIDAHVVGDRFFGTYVEDAGDAAHTGRIGGRLYVFEMPTWKFSESDAKQQVREIREQK